MQVDFEQRTQYLLARLCGRYSFAGMLRVIDRIAKESARRNVKKVLIDVSIEGDTPLMDRYEYGMYAVRALRGLEKCAAACKVPEHHAGVTFTENLVANRGFPLRVFHQTDEAIRWLVGPARNERP